MSNRNALALKLYKFNKGNRLTQEGSHLPESYKKFYTEWKLKSPAPVHYIPPSKWVRDENTGEVKRVSDFPIPLIFPPESHKGIWGGEGVIKGFQKRSKNKQRVPHWWVPNLKLGVVYSEILDKRFSVTLTNRTIDLIVENHGFDHYLLKTPACNLQSTLALKLKRTLLHTLNNKDSLYKSQPHKAEKILNKYGHYLQEYTAEDIEWYGLTFFEALNKYNSEMEENNKPLPLKHSLRKEYFAHLLEEKIEKASKNPDVTNRSWLKRINPFSK